MKKLVLIIALIVAPIAGFGQGLFDKYEENDDVTSVVFTKKVFRMLAELKLDIEDPEAKEVLDLGGRRSYSIDGPNACF